MHDFDEPHHTIRTADQFYRNGADDVPKVIIYQSRIFKVSFTHDTPSRMYLIEHRGQTRLAKSPPVDRYVRWDKYGIGNSNVAVFDNFQQLLEVLSSGRGVISR